MSRPTLAIVPARPETPQHLDRLARCLVSLWSTAPDLRVLVAAAAADPLVETQLQAVAAELNFGLMAVGDGLTHAAVVNRGLERALAHGMDAVLVDPDLEFPGPGWLSLLQGRTDAEERPAAVVGARLAHPGGLLSHAGLYFSLFERTWRTRFLHAPADLPAACVPEVCPVGSGLQLIRHETLTAVGLYDDLLHDGQGAVDYCLRAFAAGLACVYEPAAAAWRLSTPLERLLRRISGESDSLLHLETKHRDTDMTPWVPPIF